MKVTKDSKRVQGTLSLTLGEASTLYGAMASRVMRMEDILYKGATRDRSDTRTREDIVADHLSAMLVMYKLRDAIEALK